MIEDYHMADVQDVPEWAAKLMERMDRLCDDVAELKGEEAEEEADEAEEEAGEDEEDEVFADAGRSSAAYHRGRVAAGRKAARTRRRSAISRHDESESEEDDKDDASKHIGFDGLVDKLEDEGKSKHYAKAIAGKVAQEKKAKHKHDEEFDGVEGEEDEDDDKRDESLSRADEGEGEREESEDEREGKNLAHDEDEDETRDEDEHREQEDEAEEEMSKDDSLSRDEIRRLRMQVKNLAANMNRMSAPLSAADRDALAAAQARADSIGSALGIEITRPLSGERPLEYRRRMAAKFQKFSDATKKVDVSTIPVDAFGLIEERIYADATAAITDPATFKADQLIEHREVDAAGRSIFKYYGTPNAWMRPFTPQGSTLVHIADPNSFRSN